jgi:hypothetical protein
MKRKYHWSRVAVSFLSAQPGGFSSFLADSSAAGRTMDALEKRPFHADSVLACYRLQSFCKEVPSSPSPDLLVPCPQ